MIKKIGKIAIATVLMLFIIVITTAHAFTINENNQEFAKVSSNEAKPGEEVLLTIDLTKVEYKEFKIELNNDNNIQVKNLINGDTGEELNKDNIEQNNKSITISNIENLTSLILSYKMPKTAQAGSNITINIIITNCEKNKDNEKMQTQINVNVVDQKADQGEDKKADSNNEFNKDMNNNQDNTIKENKNNNDKMVENSNNMSTNNQKEETKINETKTTKQETTSISNTKSQQSNLEETYNGSSSNYLENITINNENIENFNKTNTTYFKTLQTNTDNVEIKTTQSEQNETVCIYGNNNLKKGLNKILISVTAQDGTVRNYRIYLTIS